LVAEDKIVFFSCSAI